MALFPDSNGDPTPPDRHSYYDDEDRIPWPILGAMVLALMIALLFGVSYVRDGFEPLGPARCHDAGRPD